MTAPSADPPAAAKPETVVAAPPPDPNYPRYRVEPGDRCQLATIDPNQTEHYTKRKEVTKELGKIRARIADLQARLYGEHQRSLLIVLQAMGTGGKDGTIEGVFEGVNPQGCQVWSFKAPSTEERDHDFLWRYHQRSSAARNDPHLQRLALRGRTGRPGEGPSAGDGVAAAL